MTKKIALFSGNSNPGLSTSIASHLGLPLGKAQVGRFSDGEISISIEENVRGKDVFILQSLSRPTNDHLMELLLMADALHRSSAGSVNAVIPYYGYARQDRRTRSERLPISAKVVANLISTCHVSRVLTVDLHAEQIQGFFDIPVDNIYASNALVEDIRTQFPNISDDSVAVVSPDIGGIQRARAVAKQLNVGLVIVDKRRPKPNQAEVMNVIGDVSGKTAILIDDMVDTAGTLTNVAQALSQKGAKRVLAYATHAIFSGNACQNIANSALEEVVIANTAALPKEAQTLKKIRQIDLSPLLAECIRRIAYHESVSAIFKH